MPNPTELEWETAVDALIRIHAARDKGEDCMLTVTTPVKKRRIFICGPSPGGRSYSDSVEHGERRQRQKKCDPACFFCEAGRHPDKYECVDGVWRDKKAL